MNKKSQIVTFYDIASWVILIIGLTIWLIILRFENVGSSYAIKNQVQNLNNDEIFLTILRTENNDVQISDLLIISYTNKDPDNLETIIDPQLTNLYGAEVCWKLFVNDDSFINKDCRTDSKDVLLDSTVFIPFNNDELKSNKIQLVITGYKK